MLILKDESAKCWLNVTVKTWQLTKSVQIEGSGSRIAVFGSGGDPDGHILR
jgi:hypothetical protein